MLFALIGLVCLVSSVVCPDTLTKLKSYNVDIKETSVSGISSGAMMATQIQVAFSSIIKGAGIVAGGPYHCGAEHLMLYCMTTSSFVGGTPGISRTKSTSGKEIDDMANMKHQKVYIISGTYDVVVTRIVVDELYRYYVTDGHLVDEKNVVYNTHLASGHTFPTDFSSTGNNLCAQSASPYISNCDFDGAGAILQHIYGNMTHRTMQPTGDWIKFEQSEFFSHSIGMHDEAYVYVPKSCQTGAKCRLHIALHGCAQSHSNVGDKFTHNTGYDKWADANHLIVLFPQTKVDIFLHLTSFNGFLNNANACWDWLGFYGSNFATKEGPQMAAIKKMIDRITGH